VPGAFLRVVEPGTISAGDAIKIVRQPSHDVTVSLVFRALTAEPDLLPLILAADALPTECRDTALSRTVCRG
jgi:MOSC domain-containing protein YiiM